MKSLPVESSPVPRQLGEKRVCEKTTVTFLAQCVKLFEERWEMHNDARANDARDGRTDQSCTTELSITWPRGEGKMTAYRLVGDGTRRSFSRVRAPWVR
jgi:hypothetical protein